MATTNDLHRDTLITFNPDTQNYGSSNNTVFDRANNDCSTLDEQHQLFSPGPMDAQFPELMGNDYLTNDERQQHLLLGPGNDQFSEPMGNDYGVFDEQQQLLLPGPVNNRFSAPIGNSYSIFEEQYNPLWSEPMDHQFPDAGQQVFGSLERSVASAAIVPRSPRQNVSATFANNPDTFNPSVRPEFGTPGQPIQGSATYTGSGLDDGMHNPALFSDWMPSASTCGVRQEGGHGANHLSRPLHDHDQHKIYDNLFENSANYHLHNGEGHRVDGRFYLQCKLEMRMS